MSDGSSKFDCKNCHHVFKYNELKIRYDKYGGGLIQNKVCPKCGSLSWSNYKERAKLRKYLNLNCPDTWYENKKGEN